MVSTPGSLLVTRIKLAKTLTGLRSFLTTELRVKTFFWGDVAGNITMPSSPANLQQNGANMQVTVTYPASGNVLVIFNGVVFPTANDSEVLVGINAQETEILVSGEGKGRKTALAYITGQPFTTTVYNLTGFYAGGSGAAFQADSSSGARFVVTVVPL